MNTLCATLSVALLLITTLTLAMEREKTPSKLRYFACSDHVTKNGLLNHYLRVKESDIKGEIGKRMVNNATESSPLLVHQKLMGNSESSKYPCTLATSFGICEKGTRLYELYSTDIKKLTYDTAAQHIAALQLHHRGRERQSGDFFELYPEGKRLVQRYKNQQHILDWLDVDSEEFAEDYIEYYRISKNPIHADDLKMYGITKYDCQKKFSDMLPSLRNSDQKTLMVYQSLYAHKLNRTKLILQTALRAINQDLDYDEPILKVITKDQAVFLMATLQELKNENNIPFTIRAEGIEVIKKHIPYQELRENIEKLYSLCNRLQIKDDKQNVEIKDLQRALEKLNTRLERKEKRDYGLSYRVPQQKPEWLDVTSESFKYHCDECYRIREGYIDKDEFEKYGIDERDHEKQFAKALMSVTDEAIAINQSLYAHKKENTFILQTHVKILDKNISNTVKDPCLSEEKIIKTMSKKEAMHLAAMIETRYRRGKIFILMWKKAGLQLLETYYKNNAMLKKDIDSLYSTCKKQQKDASEQDEKMSALQYSLEKLKKRLEKREEEKKQ
jgi:hypothetical protein